MLVRFFKNSPSNLTGAVCIEMPEFYSDIIIKFISK